MISDNFLIKLYGLSSSTTSIKRFKQLALDLAVSGRLLPQDAKDEHANVTLGKASVGLLPLPGKNPYRNLVGWSKINLGCAIKSNTGGGTPPRNNPSYWNGSIPWASVKDIGKAKHISATEETITQSGLDCCSSNLIPAGRLIVVTRMGLGKLAVNTVPMAINQDLRAIEPTEALDLNFAYLLFKSLKLVGSGVTVKGITVQKLHEIEVGLPPLAEQRRIVAKVDELMALCDRLEAQLKERDVKQAALAKAALAKFTEDPTPANLQLLFHPSFTVEPEDLRSLVLGFAIRGKLIPQDKGDEPAAELLARIIEKSGKWNSKKSNKPDAEAEIVGDFLIPQNWIWSELGKAFDVRDGTHDTPAYTAKGYPLITSKNIYGGTLSFEGAKLISKEDHLHISERSKVARDDILFAMIGSIGNPVIVNTDIDFSIKNLALFKYHSRVDSEPRFLLLYLRLVEKAMKAEAAGGVQSFVSLGYLRKYRFPLPPLSEQKRIASRVETLFAQIDKLEAQLEASRTTGEKLLEAMVAELTSA